MIKAFHAAGKTIILLPIDRKRSRPWRPRHYAPSRGSGLYGPPRNISSHEIYEKLCFIMMKNIITLTFNDLAIAFKNKTIFLIVFIPLFVFFSEISRQCTTDYQKVRIGLIQTQPMLRSFANHYPSAMESLPYRAFPAKKKVKAGSKKRD